MFSPIIWIILLSDLILENFVKVFGLSKKICDNEENFYSANFFFFLQ